MIDFNHVSFTYEEGAPEAVKDVTLHIEKGAFTAVLGHNGSGKSTLAKMMNGLYLPSRGEVTVDGLLTSDENNTWEIRKRAGMIFQNPDNQLVATMVEDDVAFGLENLGIPPKDMPARIKKALEDVDMLEYIHRAPHLLSGGQKQRVAIAGIMAMEPKAIICDESTAMLDPQGRKEVFDVMHRLNEEKGITVVWITHFMEEAAKCKDVFVMHEGEMVMHDVPRKIFNNPDLLRPYHLDVPQMAQLSYDLRKAGVSLPDGILDAKELCQEVCRLWS